MSELVTAELIDRNLLISKLMKFEVNVSGLRGARYVKAEVERLIHEEVVQLVREQPYYRV